MDAGEQKSAMLIKNQLLNTFLGLGSSKGFSSNQGSNGSKVVNNKVIQKGNLPPLLLGKPTPVSKQAQGEAKKAQGLRFKCNDKYFPGHQ